ncbi:MAG: hypothetical protein LBU70_04830 [Chitinispirillales bacterium]|jgi:hypothetical protein|nr:hypothetical protein [Chitinispirillales bacterium]
MRTLRPYTVKDVRTIVGIMSGLAKSNLKSILTANASGGDAAPPPDSAESTEERIGKLIFEILAECWDHSEEAIFAWFASLNEMTVEQFNNEDPNAVLDTIETIVERKESRDFFYRASALFRKIGFSE